MPSRHASAHNTGPMARRTAQESAQKSQTPSSRVSPTATA
jgi:hypothetical protein